MAVFIDENVARQKYCFLLGSEHTLAPPPDNFLMGWPFLKNVKCQNMLKDVHTMSGGTLLFMSIHLI